MDRQIDAATLRRRAAVRLLRPVTVLALLVAGLMMTIYWLTPRVALADLRTAPVESGEVSSTIAASGVVMPKSEEVIASPITARIQTVMTTLGAELQQGDPILQLDGTAIEREIARLNDQLELKAVEEHALRHKTKADIGELKSRQELLAIDLKSQTLRLQRYQALYAKNAISKFDVDDRAVQVEKIEVELRQLDQRMNDLETNADNQLERLNLEKNLLRQQLAEQQRLLRDSLVRATSPGVVTSLLDQPGGNVSAGAELARVANLEQFHVQASVSDFYRSQLRGHLPVRIATNQTTVHGRISKILPAVAAEGTLSILIDFDAQPTMPLQPNMRLDLEIITRQENEGLRVRNGVAFNGSGSQDVFVLEDDALHRRTVEIGLINSQYVQIVSGLDAGETVVISNMQSYLHLDQVALR